MEPRSRSTTLLLLTGTAKRLVIVNLFASRSTTIHVITTLTTRMSSIARGFVLFCGQNGHMIENCYKKHGFPLGYKTNNKGGNVNSADTNQEGKIDSIREGHDFKLSQQ